MEKYRSRSRGSVPLVKLTAVCDTVALNGCHIQLCSFALLLYRLIKVKDEGWGGGGSRGFFAGPDLALLINFLQACLLVDYRTVIFYRIVSSGQIL